MNTINNGTSCPNCGISCVGCAGARITTASDGKVCCTKCVGAYEQSIRRPSQGASTQLGSALKIEEPSDIKISHTILQPSLN